MSETNGRGRYRQASPRRKGVHWMDKAILPCFELTVGDALLGLAAVALCAFFAWVVATGDWIEVM